MQILLVLVVFLASLPVSDGISCTPDPQKPCQCSLRDGAAGTIDLSPLVSKGPLLAFEHDSYNYKYSFDPCTGLLCANHCQLACAMCQTGIPDNSVNSGLGRVESPQYTIASIDPQTRTFSMSVQYTHGNGDRMAIVEFVYNATTEEPYLVFDKENPSKTYRFHLYTNGPGVRAANATEPKPGNTSGPYPIQKDACTGWSGEKSVLAKSGLMKLSAQAAVLNYTWTKGEDKFEYHIGVCVSPAMSPIRDCFVVQKTTSPNGTVSTRCLGENMDVQVTNTQGEGWMLLSYAYVDDDAFQCDNSARRVKIFFTCSPEEKLGTPLFIVQNPLQDDCFYQFTWPTSILCGPINTTQPSHTDNQSPISMEGAVLIGIEGVSFLVLVVLLVITTVATCCMYRSGKSNSDAVSTFYRMNEPAETQEGKMESEPEDI